MVGGRCCGAGKCFCQRRPWRLPSTGGRDIGRRPTESPAAALPAGTPRPINHESCASCGCGTAPDASAGQVGLPLGQGALGGTNPEGILGDLRGTCGNGMGCCLRQKAQCFKIYQSLRDCLGTLSSGLTKSVCLWMTF